MFLGVYFVHIFVLRNYSGLFCLFVFETEKEGMKLGRQGGSGKSWGKRNGDQNIKNLFSIKS